MLRCLAVLVALTGMARAETRVYDVKATRLIEGAERGELYPSCGAGPRMLKDRHVLRIDDDGDVTVNRMRWTKVTDEPDLFISFHSGNGQYTRLLMDLYVNQNGLSGRYILVGAIPDKDDPKTQYICLDAVHLDGTRR